VVKTSRRRSTGGHLIFVVLPSLIALGALGLFVAYARSGGIQPYGTFHVRGSLEQVGYPHLSEVVPQVMVWGIREDDGDFFYLSQDQKPVTTLESPGNTYAVGDKVYAKGSIWAAKTTLGKMIWFLEFSVLDKTPTGGFTDPPANPNPVIEFIWGIRVDSEG